MNSLNEKSRTMTVVDDVLDLRKRLQVVLVLLVIVVFANGCTDNILNQVQPDAVSPDIYWETTDDAENALNGVYNAMRRAFGRDYYWDGAGEFVHARGRSDTWYSNSYDPQPLGGGFNNMWGGLYRTINRANNVIDNINQMAEDPDIAADEELLDRYIAEAVFLRAISYFRLIDLWGDVPYFERVLDNEEAIQIVRTPRREIKDTILADLEYAAEVLPESYPASDQGRATKLAALSFSGKVKLFWASWMKYEGETAEANEHFASAADDFREVMDPAYGLDLFRGGEPGEWQMPNYWHLFQYENEHNPEIIFSAGFGGPHIGQGEEMARDFGTRQIGGAQTWVIPNYRLVNRYQLRSTGDFAEPLVLANDSELENGAINPETYEDRDYRMKATILWDGQKLLPVVGDAMGDSLEFRHGFNDGVNYHNYGNARTGYIFRKWVRQEVPMFRSDGPQDFYLMRLADVFLMYAEAVNEVNGGPTPELFELVDRIRNRGNLPPLDRSQYNNYEAFFDAIEQERIVEFVAEGQRFFDIRRWRKAEEIWAQPDGLVLYDTWGQRIRDEFVNAQQRDFERYYIFRIPPAERDRNPNLTQNEPWL